MKSGTAAQALLPGVAGQFADKKMPAVGGLAARDAPGALGAQALSRIHWAANSSERAWAVAPLVNSQTSEPAAKRSGTRARKRVVMVGAEV